MSELRIKLSERISEIEAKLTLLGDLINKDSESLQKKKLELDQLNKELSILLRAKEDLEKEGL